MASPSENLQSIADTLGDISLYTNATNQSLLGVNGTILNVGRGIVEMLKSVSLGKSTQSAARVGKTQEEKDAAARDKAIKSQMREDARAAKEEQRSKALLVREADRVAREFQKSKQMEERNQKRQENNQKRARENRLNATPDANFKNIISGAGGGITGLFASVAIETKNFTASIQKAYGDGGLGGLIRATAQATTAFTGIPGALMSIVKAASPFVTALDPALMAKLGLAFADLMAVVGYGLRPIIVMAIAAIKMFGDMLLPVMKAMAPAISSMAGSIMQLVVPVLKIWVDSITQMLPVIESMGFLFRTVGETLAWASPLLNLGFKTIAAGINGLIGTIAMFVAVVKSMISVLLEIVANVLSKIPFMGGAAKKTRDASRALDDSAGKDFNDAVGAFGRMFKNPNVGPVQQGAGSGMAARGASFAGIGDLGKNLMQAAFGSSTEKIQQDQLEAQRNGNDILGQIGQMVAVIAGVGGKMAGVRN